MPLDLSSNSKCRISISLVASYPFSAKSRLSRADWTIPAHLMRPDWLTVGFSVQTHV